MIRKSEYIFSKSLLAVDDKHDLRIISLGKPNKTLNNDPLEWLDNDLVITEGGLDENTDYLEPGFFTGDVYMTHTLVDYGAGGSDWDFDVDVKDLKRVCHD